VHERLASYRKVADLQGSEKRVAVATSAVRDATNGAAFRAAVQRRHGFETAVISGEREARLTFLGATAGRAGGPTLVFDIGGGSTEYVIGFPGEVPSFHVSTPLGSVRHTERHIRTDPPGRDELERLWREVVEVVRADVPKQLRQATGRGIAVAGTATSLAAIDQQVDPHDPARVHGYPLTLEAAERILAELAALPVSERREVTGLLPARAPTIVAGAAILVESMRAFELDFVEVSHADILHGTAISARLYG
jgi:exopolyphosphatase / guanosine-5'-triphosphate,3'-diphosphate pyrophosphatase